MKPDDEQKLEAEISRALQALPELSAPPALGDRVLRVIAQRNRLPWYRRSWATWPAPLRAASFAALVVLFGGLCLASWQLSHGGAAAFVWHRLEGWFSGLNVIVDTVSVLANVAVLVVKQLGTGLLVSMLVLMGLGYALCVGLGTVYFRIGFAKH